MNDNIVKPEYICKDCKHCFISKIDRAVSLITFRPPSKYDYRCSMSFTAGKSEYDPVTGVEKTRGEFDTCVSARRKYGKCGPDAEHWSPRSKKDLFKLLVKVKDE